MVRKLKDRVQHKFGVPLAEVGGQNTWQRAVLAFATVSGDRAYIDSVIGNIVDSVEASGLATLGDVETEVMTFGDEPMAAWAGWKVGLE